MNYRDSFSTRCYSDSTGRKNITSGYFYRKQLYFSLLLLTCLNACGQNLENVPGRNETITPAPVAPNQQLALDKRILNYVPLANPERNVYFGDLHVHTGNSFDAFTFGTTATPYDAYRYALGETIAHPSGFSLTLKRPLDFYAVTDHAVFLGVAREAADTTTDFSQHSLAAPLHNLNIDDNKGLSTLAPRARLFSSFTKTTLSAVRDGELPIHILDNIMRRAWRDTIRAADLYNMPGRFTTFVGYEYTSRTDDRGNLHRNVIFRDSRRLPRSPFSRLHSQNPEGLWDWMDWLRDSGIESLAIPHNSNASNGQMFKLTDWAGDPMDEAYAQQRMRNEPLVEVTQVKGTSETHPLLSDNDEWANFEIAPFRIGTRTPSAPPGGYVRDAYLRGMKLQSKGAGNPYKFGMIGSSDSHVGATSDREDNFFSKSGVMDGSALARGSVPLSFFSGTLAKIATPDLVTKIDGENYFTSSAFETWGASGLAAVWAEENTRGAIYDAFRRKETYATSGPRISLRFFAGYDFDPSMLRATDIVNKAYAGGVSMGGDLIQRGTDAPKFLLWTARDSSSASLQRAQIIKGYVENGEPVEIIYDIACSNGLSPDPGTHRCPDNGARVDIKTCEISEGIGDFQLLTLWQDPNFDAEQEAFYYARVLENPTCRWSTWDAVKAGVKPREDLQPTLQERAWSSPIWYHPKH